MEEKLIKPLIKIILHFERFLIYPPSLRNKPDETTPCLTIKINSRSDTSNVRVAKQGL
jgi:hypothetical protein